jgi:hypothetical protein
LGLTTALALAGGWQARAAVDLTVTGIEITQGIQTPGNTIAVVANRNATVRATIGVSGTGGADVPNVTGQLHILLLGIEIGVINPSNVPFTAKVTPLRGNQNDTLNFDVPLAYFASGSPSLDFRVDITPVPGEVNTGNNSLTASSSAVANPPEPIIYYANINYAGHGYVDDAAIQPGVGDAMLKGVYPVKDLDETATWLYVNSRFRPSLGHTSDPAHDFDANQNGIVDGGDGDALFTYLESCRQALLQTRPELVGVSSDRVFLYGWLHGDVIAGAYGWAVGIGSGNVAFGVDLPERYQRTFAHEMGHLFGFVHEFINIDQVGWDVLGRLKNNPSVNNIPLDADHGLVKDTDKLSYMWPGTTTAETWTPTGHFNTVLTKTSLIPPAPDTATNGSSRFSTNVLVIRGLFNTNGTQLLSLGPFYTYPWPSAAPLANANGPTNQFVARITDSLGSITNVPFSAMRQEDGTNSSLSAYGFFSLMVPLPTGRVATNVDIVTIGTSNVLGKLGRSVVKPTIQVLLPASGAQLGASTFVSFSVSDSDTPSSNREYQVVYSPNDGKNWVPVGVNIPGQATFITFDSTMIPETRGKGRLRVIASDGFNTSYADVSNLTTTASSVPNPDYPRLTAATMTNGQVTLSWPALAPGFKLQSAPSLPYSGSNISYPSWSSVTNAVPSIVAGRYVVTLPAASVQQYYRLGRSSLIPDLVPVPDPVFGFSVKDGQGNLLITVKNQGTGDAGPSITRVHFGNVSGYVDVATPAIPAGQYTILAVPIPGTCYQPDCGFYFDLDADNQVDEWDDTNNRGSGGFVG